MDRGALNRSFFRIALLIAPLIATVAAPPLAAQRDPAPLSVRQAEVLGGLVLPEVFDGDLRDLPKVRPWAPGDPIRAIPRIRHGASAPLSSERRADELVEIQRAAPRLGDSYTFGVNRDGMAFTGTSPPDADGDVGVDYFIQVVNGNPGALFTVYDKSDGSVVSGPTALDSLGTGDCAEGFIDPVVLYDELEGRWLLAEISDLGNTLCVYTSRTGDPVTGGWCQYPFDTGANFPDYPKLAVWPDVLVMTSNEGNAPPVYALDRLNMYSPDGATCPTARPLQRLTVDGLPAFGFEALTPADLDGDVSPPPGSPAYVLRHRDTEAHGPFGLPEEDQLELWELDVDFDESGNTTLTGPQVIPISEFSSDLCGFTLFDCFNQPGGADLDPLREVVMNRVQYRNLGGAEILVGNMVTNLGTETGEDDGGIRWFELRREEGAWSLFQEGTVGDLGENRWLGSLAMDGEGNVALAYVHASTSIFPGNDLFGRLATDPPGTMPRGEENIVLGTGASSTSRYGDYNALTVDPVDDCTFWWSGEYNAAATWSTRIASFKFAACGAPPEILFEDGFESGDTTAWSATIP